MSLQRYVVNSFVMHLDADELIQRSMAKGDYEPSQSDWMRQCLSEGDGFVDIGASFGHYATLASTIVGPAGEVFAFEPSPLPASVLRTTIAENQISNIRLIEAAVGEADGSVTLFVPPAGEPVHSPSVNFSDSRFMPLIVPKIALDSYAPLRDAKPIDLMKIDAEGYEPNILTGMRELAREGLVRNLFCELNSGWLKRNASTPEGLYQQILDCGFVPKERTGVAVHKDADGSTFTLEDVWFSHQDGAI